MVKNAAQGLLNQVGLRVLMITQRRYWPVYVWLFVVVLSKTLLADGGLAPCPYDGCGCDWLDHFIEGPFGCQYLLPPAFNTDCWTHFFRTCYWEPIEG